MALFNVTLNLVIDTAQLSRIEAALAVLNLKGTSIMSTITEVNAKLDTVVAAQGVVANEVNEAVEVLGEIKAALDAAIAAGASPAELQALSDRLDGVATGLTGSAAALDAAATAADITP